MKPVYRFEPLRILVWLAWVAMGAAVLIPLRAQAYFELSAFYFSEAETAASTTNSSRMFLETALGFKVDKQGQYLVGWGYASHATTDSTTTSTTYASTQMGPRFLWMIDKSKNWSLGLAYYIVTQAAYSAAGSSEAWKGTALHFDLGYNQPVSDEFLVGVRLNYSAASYAEKLVGSTTYSTVSYSKTHIYPSLSLIYIF